MNRIYRLVWNHALHALQVASELVPGCSAAASSVDASRRLPARRLLALCCLAACTAVPVESAMAACSPVNPTNGATVTCSGAANPLAPSYASGASNLTVNVVSGGSTGVLLGLGGTAMSLTGNGTTLNNAGTIDPSLLGLLSLLSSGTVIGNPNLGTAIPGSTVTVSNQGTMKGTTGLLGLNLADLTGMALSVRNGGGGTTNIANSGTIGSSALLGVSLLGSDAPVIAAYGGSQINFTNTGTITGRTAFESSAAGNTFINAGTISGSVSMGTNSTNTFTAVTGSNVNAGGSLGLNLLGVLGINLSFAPTGQIDGGAGGNNTLVLQNVVAGPGSGATGTGSASSATYVNFQHLIVNSGTWSLSGALISGDATLNGGVAQFDSDANFGSAAITANGGGVAASIGGATLSKAITLNAGGLTATGANNFTLSGTLSGSGPLTKSGTGTVTLTAADSYTGGTFVTGGTLALGGNGALASSGQVSLLNAGSVFDISAANGNRTVGMLTGDTGTTVSLGARTLTFGDSANATFAGTIGGTGGVIKQGSGVETLTGVNTYTGGTTINAGGLAIGTGGSLAATGAVTLSSAGGIFDISNAGANQTIGALSGVAGSQVALGANTLSLGDAGNTTFAGTIGGTGGIVKQGPGTLTLSSANTYTGGTTINAGTLQIGSGGSLAAGSTVALAAPGSTLDLSAAGAQSIGALSGVAGSSALLGANALTLSPTGSSSFGGTIGGTGGVTINGTGTETLTGANTYTGGTSIQSGTLALGPGGSLAGGSALTLASGGTFDISTAGNQAIGALAGTGGTIKLGANTLSVSGGGTLDAAIQGTGGLTNTANALVLNGTNSYTGLTTVQGGSLTVGDASHASASVAGDVSVASGAALGGFGTVGGSVTVQNGGHLAAGSPTGTFTVNTNLTLAQGSVLDFSFGAPGPNFSTFGSGHNVAVNGNLAINGATLNPIDAGGFGPGLYNLFTYGGTLTETNGGIIPPSGFTIQNLTASKQVNLINTNGLTLNFWNANGLASSTRMGGGSGVWSVPQANWANATGSITSTRQPADAFAIFGGDAGMVTVDNTGGAVTALGMQFASDGFHLVGGALGLVAPTPGALSEIRVGDGSSASAGWIATVDNTLTGLGFNKTGAGTLVLGGSNTYTQGTMLSAGTLSVSADANLGAAGAGLDLEGGILQVTGTAFQSTARAITLGAPGGGFDIADAANVFAVSQALSGTGGLTKLGAGTLVLSGANNYSGGTTISAGTLQGDAGSLQGNVVDNAALVFNQGTNGAFVGNVSGSGTLTKLGAGVLTLSGANSYSGGTVISAGTLQGDTTSLQGNITDNASLVFNQGTNGTFTGAISGSGSLSKLGSGTVTLGGTSTYGGGTTIGAGALQGDTTSLQGNITDNASLIFNQGTNGTFAGAISGSGSLSKLGSGTVTLSGANNYSGGTTIGAGALQGDTTSLQGNITDNASLVFNQGTNGTFAGAISGSGSLSKLGSGTLTLNGTHTYSGGTTISAGTLVVGSSAGNGATLGGNVTVDGGATLRGHGTIGGNVDVLSGGIVTPGDSIGTLTVNGDFTAAQGSLMDFAFGAPGANFQTAGTGDSVSVGGKLSLNGATLNVTDAGGMGPGLYNLFTYAGTLTETSGGLSLGTAPGGQTLFLQNLTAQKQINLIDTTGITANVWNANGQASATQMGGGSGTWSTTSQVWTDATGAVTNGPMSPQPGFAIFGGAAGTVTVDGSAGSVSATGLQFATTGYTLAGGTLTLVASNGNAPIVRVGDGSSAGAAMTATINSAIAGSAGLTKTDLGTLVLGGANTYAGNTAIAGGTLEAANSGALGSGSATVDNSAGQNATLKVDSGVSLGNQILLANGGTLDNAGSIVRSGSGTYAVEADTGSATIVNTGSLQSDSGVVLNNGGTVTNNGGSLAATGSTSAGLYVGGAAATIANANGGSISGGYLGVQMLGGSLVNTGAHSVIQGSGYGVFTNDSAANVTNSAGASIQGTGNDAVSMYQGGTVINEGGASISGTVGVRLSGNGSMINRTGASITGSLGVILAGNGTVDNSASIVASNTGVALVGSNDTLTNAAGALIRGGTASVNTAGGNGAVNLTNAGTLDGDVWLTGNAANAVTLLTGSTLQGRLYIGNNTSSTLTLDGSGTQLYSQAVTGATTFMGALTKLGSGTWILDSALTPGGTTINAGTLQIGNGDTTGAIAGNVTDNGTLAFSRSDAVSFGGTISGSGALVQAGSGTLTLTGTSTYAGGTTINAGTLQIGNGGTTGAIAGNVTDNGTLAFDRSDAVNFGGAISGSGALVQAGSGTLALTGTNTYTGGTTINAGTLQIGNGGTSGAIAGNVTDNGTLTFNRSDAVNFGGTISGSGVLVQAGSGTLTLTGTNTYAGGTAINAGTLQIGNGGSTGAIAGNVADNGTLAFNRSDAASFAGIISGSGTLAQNGTGTLTLTGANTYTGGTIVNAGTLVVDSTSLPGAVLDNAALVFAQANDGVFRNAISGSGTLAKTGGGMLILDGDSSAFTGSTTVGAGTLEVGDAATPSAVLGGNVAVGAGGTLRGYGRILGNVSNSGTLWAGGSIGTLTVQGNYTQSASGVFEVEATPSGQASLLAVNGTATLAGSALVLADTGTWAPTTSYTILTAGGGVSGQFASASSSLAFLNPVVNYGANVVTLSLQRNDVAMASVAQTPNQKAVATAANSLGFGNPVYDALVVLDAPAARHAFDQLSGEIHASTRTAIADNDHYVRDAIGQHLAGQNNNANGLNVAGSDGVAAWTAAWGHWGSHDGDGNASTMSSNGSGLLLGADMPVGSDARLGAVLGTGQGTARVDALGSSSHVVDQHLGVYGSLHTGALQWQGGAIYGWQKVDTHRFIGFGTFGGSALSNYRAHSAQAYVDASMPFVQGRTTLAPFVNLAVERLGTPAIRENGTAAALAVAGQDSTLGYGTLGLRATFDLGAPNHGLHAHASLGWQHAWGDTLPVGTMRFESGGGSFAIASLPVAKNAGVFTTGISFTVAPDVSVDGSYQGQFGQHATDQSARISLDWKF